jgi:hypothetical protein
MVNFQQKGAGELSAKVFSTLRSFRRRPSARLDQGVARVMPMQGRAGQGQAGGRAWFAPRCVALGNYGRRTVEPRLYHVVYLARGIGNAETAPQIFIGKIVKQCDKRCIHE